MVVSMLSCPATYCKVFSNVECGCIHNVGSLTPEVIQGQLDGDGLSSCSAAEALDRQEPFLNPTLSNHALALLARLFRYGTISYQGAFVGLSSLAGLQALRIDPKCWQRLRRKAGCREISKRNPAALAEASPQGDQG
jgi:hypothetical protein